MKLCTERACYGLRKMHFNKQSFIKYLNLVGNMLLENLELNIITYIMIMKL